MIVGTSGPKNTYQTPTAIGTAWDGFYNLNAAGNIITCPSDTEKELFVFPDGRNVHVHWNISKEDSKPGEVALAIGSAGDCQVQLRWDKLAYTWNASNTLVSNPGVSSQPLLYCIPLLTANRLNCQTQTPRGEMTRKSTLFPLGNSECVPIIDSPLPIFSIHHYPCL